jgi:hypothetical protein
MTQPELEKIHDALTGDEYTWKFDSTGQPICRNCGWTIPNSSTQNQCDKCWNIEQMVKQYVKEQKKKEGK